MRKREYRIVLSAILVLVFVSMLILIKFSESIFDYSISNLTASFHGNLMNGFFIFLGNYSKIIMILLSLGVVALLYFQNKKIKSAMLAIMLTTGFILEQILKLIVQRDRPYNQLITETDYSFPSGHSIFSIILFSFIIYFYKDEIKNKIGKAAFILINIFLIFLVGFSRIYLNVHWFTDIIGGYVLGFLLVNLGILFLESKKIIKKIK